MYEYNTLTVALCLTEEKPPAGLSLGAKIGIGVASFFFFGLLAIVVIILCDLKPKDKRRSAQEKNGNNAKY